MKRTGYISVFIVLLLAIICLFSGCGSKNESEKTDNTTENITSGVNSEKDDETSDVNNITETAEKKPEKLTENNAGKVYEKTGTTEKTEAVSAVDKTAVTSENNTQTATEKKENKTTKSSAFFDGAVFVGDSVTMGLRNYVTSERNKGNDCLGKAAFLTAGSMGYTNSLPDIGVTDSIHPNYQGKEMHIEDALALMKPDKVFIMLGMNDFCIYSVQKAIGNTEECINRIKTENPDVDIYIESVTPVLRDRGSFCNANIDKFNAALKEFCKANGYGYVDIASVMKNPDGALIASYCSDPEGKGIHMTYEGCSAWVDYLYEIYCQEK